MNFIPSTLAADSVDISGLESTISKETGIKIFANLGELLSGKEGATSLLQILFVIIGVLFLINVVMAGWDYMLSTGDPKKVSAASTRFLNGVIGLLLSLTAFLVVRIVASVIGVGGEGLPGI